MRLLKLTPLIAVAVVTAVTALTLTACGGALNARIGGNVSGLAGATSVGLLNNGSDAITVSANGSFTFDKTVSSKGAYLVTVNKQPTGETCTVVNGSGTVDSRGNDVTNVQVSCVAGSTTTSAVSVNISGLASGATVVLLDNGVDALSVTGNATTAAGGTITQLFPTPLASGSNYSVTVGTQPTGHTCLVTNGIGTIPTSGSAAAVIVTCN